MSVLNLEKSFAKAEARLGDAVLRRRSDAGQSRMPAPVAAELERLLHSQEHPRMVDIHARLQSFCQQHRLKTPSRASIYNHIPQALPHYYRPIDLPTHVRECLYNLDPDEKIPGPQVAYYCFHYGNLKSMCFAASLPWLDLWQASRISGWRPRTRGLLDAVMLARGIR